MATLWSPPVEPSSREQKILKRCAKRRVFIFLRELRHRIFDEEMQAKLHAAYEREDRVPPAQLALASLLQAALGVPDHEVVELTAMDLRWQMVLDCLGNEEPLFSQGTVFSFRERLIEHDLDWDDPKAKKLGLEKLLAQVRALGDWLQRQLAEQLGAPPLKEQWELIEKLIAQDTEPDPDGPGRRITRGVAKERRVSISDADMRHGRKSKKQRVDGFKRHLAVDLDAPGLVCAVAITAANKPERVAASELFADVERLGVTVSELYIDRGYLDDEAIEVRREGGMGVHCKPFPLRNGVLFSKSDFAIDPEACTVRCPNGVVRPIEFGQSVHFPASTCAACPKRALCTDATATRGRSLMIHPNEPFFLELRQRAKTTEGRADLRQRVAVEHSLATLHNRQGDRARYRGARKNLFDLRRHAVISNLAVIDRVTRAAA